MITDGSDASPVMPITSKRAVYRNPAGDVVDLSTAYTALLQIWRARADAAPVVVRTDTDGITLAATAPNLLIDATPAQIAALPDGVY